MYARGLDAPTLAALSGVPLATVQTMIAGGERAAAVLADIYSHVAAALGLPAHALLTDPCPACCATERDLTGRCLVCGEVAA